MKFSTARRHDNRVEITAALPPESLATPNLSSLREQAVSEATILEHQAYGCMQKQTTAI
jgi:hypothetical protein